MIRKSTALLGAGVLVAGLAGPLTASAHAEDNTLAFIIGAAAGQAIDDDRSRVRYVHGRPGHRYGHDRGRHKGWYKWKQRDHRKHHRSYQRAHREFHRDWRRDRDGYHGGDRRHDGDRRRDRDHRQRVRHGH